MIDIKKVENEMKKDVEVINKIFQFSEASSEDIEYIGGRIEDITAFFISCYIGDYFHIGQKTIEFFISASYIKNPRSLVREGIVFLNDKDPMRHRWETGCGTSRPSFWTSARISSPFSDLRECGPHFNHLRSSTDCVNIVPVEGNTDLMKRLWRISRTPIYKDHPLFNVFLYNFHMREL